MAIGAGGLVFVAYNADGTDGFSVLATEDIGAGEIVYFSDSNFDNGTGTFSATEDTLTWTVGDAIPAGTVITFNDVNTSPVVTAPGIINTGLTSATGALALSATNEGLYAFQGTDAETPTQFLSMFQNEDNGSAGDVPTGMDATNGLVSIDGNDDVLVYDGPTAFVDASSALLAIGDSNNWISQDGSGDQSGDGTAPDFPDDVPTDFTVCFAHDTLIATPAGDVTVQTLAIGDEVLNSKGDRVAVKWIGQQTVMTRFGPAERLMPVRFAAGSLGPNTPHSDLTVTADHAMLVDGVLCNAGALVNGSTITRVPLAEMGETFTVYHIETEEHEIILANGAPAETFIDNTSRRVFDNFAEYEALFGEEAEMEELPLPRATSARQVPAAIKARLAGRVAA